VGAAVYPLLAEAARRCRHGIGDRWQVDETYVRVAGRWRYLYRTVDQSGQVIDVFVSARRGRPRPPQARLRPMRALQQNPSARVVIAGHDFVQNIRRAHYERRSRPGDPAAGRRIR
jgi:hypothetical protein